MHQRKTPETGCEDVPRLAALPAECRRLRCGRARKGRSKMCPQPPGLPCLPHLMHAAAACRLASTTSLTASTWPTPPHRRAPLPGRHRPAGELLPLVPTAATRRPTSTTTSVTGSAWSTPPAPLGTAARPTPAGQHHHPRDRFGLVDATSTAGHRCQADTGRPPATGSPRPAGPATPSRRAAAPGAHRCSLQADQHRHPCDRFGMVDATAPPGTAARPTPAGHPPPDHPDRPGRPPAGELLPLVPTAAARRPTSTTSVTGSAWSTPPAPLGTAARPTPAGHLPPDRPDRPGLPARCCT